MTAADLSTVTQWTATPVRPTVYYRNRWDDPWLQEDNLHCVTLRRGLGQQMDQAELEYETGNIDGAVRSGLDLIRCFVKIVYTAHQPATAYTWYGIIVSEVREELGKYDEGGLLDGNNQPILDNNDVQIGSSSSVAADYRYIAFGMEWLLSRVFINKSLYPGAVGPIAPVEIDRPLPFNSGTNKAMYASEVVGNKQTGANMFVEPTDFASAEKWNGYTMLNYLLDTFALFTGGLQISLAINAAGFLQWFIPNNMSVGPTMFDALNQVVSPQRGLVWSLVPDGAIEDQFYIKVNSITAVELDIDAGVTIAANDTQRTISTTELENVIVTRNTDSSRTFQQVKVYGARRGACFSLNYNEGNLAKGWTSAQQTSYENAASAVSPQGDRKALADAFRASDAMENVFTRFVVPTTWDQKWPGSAPRYPVCPRLSSDGSILTFATNSWMPGLRFLNWLPMRQELDYSPAKGADDVITPTGTTASATSPYRQPFVCYHLGNNKYVRGDRASSLGKNEKYGQGGISFSSSVHALPDQFGVEVRPTGLAHVHAFGDVADLVNYSDTEPEVDWREMIVTVFAEFDERLMAAYPSVPDEGENGQSTILEIDVGPVARLDYLAPGTIIGINEDGSQKTHPTGGWLRKDRSYVQRVANVAYEWYSRRRIATTIQCAQITQTLNPGDMITDIDSEAVVTIVSHVMHDFNDQATTISTEYAEIDPVGLVITPMGGSIR